MLETLKAEVFDWLEENHWKGHDPFDGLTSPLLKKLPQNRWMRLAFLQFIKRSPFNLRPLLSMKPHENAMTWAAAILGALEAIQRGETSKKDFIQKAVERLFHLQTEGTNLWGYPFPWQAKAFYLHAGEPNLVLSALCLRALRRSPLTEGQKNRYAQSQEALFKHFYKKEHGFFSYVAHDTILVHNANLLGAEALASCEKFQPEARRAVSLSLKAQEPSGRWPYGTLPHHQWCDNFHTAYHLISLAELYRTFQKGEMARAIEKGLNYYLSHAFTPEGLCRYYDNRTYPLETHTAAVALICLREMAQGGWMKKENAQPMAEKICARLKQNFYLGEGKFLYRQGRFLKNKTVFTRWTQAWVYAGLEAAASLFNS